MIWFLIMILNNHREVYNFCTIYIVLLIITSITLMSIDRVCIYIYWHTIKIVLINFHIKYINGSNKRNYY